MRRLFLLGAGVTILFGGCAHTAMRGSVAMKATDDELHICMGETEVRTGDRVAFFINQCRESGNSRAVGRDVCTKIKIGEGAVVRSLNEHYSVVKPDPGIGAKIGEGTVVEKL